MEKAGINKHMVLSSRVKIAIKNDNQNYCPDLSFNQD